MGAKRVEKVHVRPAQRARCHARETNASIALLRMRGVGRMPSQPNMQGVGRMPSQPKRATISTGVIEAGWLSKRLHSRSASPCSFRSSAHMSRQLCAQRSGCSTLGGGRADAPSVRTAAAQARGPSDRTHMRGSSGWRDRKRPVRQLPSAACGRRRQARASRLTGGGQVHRGCSVVAEGGAVVVPNAGTHCGRAGAAGGGARRGWRGDGGGAKGVHGRTGGRGRAAAQRGGGVGRRSG